MKTYKFEAPWPPSVNVWKTPFRNRMILTKRGRDYRLELIKACDDLGISGEYIGQDVSVSLVLNPPTLRKYDVDNFTKSLFDGLTHADFWLDDSQVVDLRVRKGGKVKGGNVEVTVKLLDE